MFFFPNAGWRLSRLWFLPCWVEKTRQLQQRALGWQKVAATAAARNCYVNMAQQRLEERKNEIHLLFVLFVHISSFERALRPFSLFLATSSDNRIGFSRVVVVFVPQSVLCITTTTSKKTPHKHRKSNGEVIAAKWMQYKQNWKMYFKTQYKVQFVLLIVTTT